MPASLQEIQKFEPAITWLWELDIMGVPGLGSLPGANIKAIPFPEPSLEADAKFNMGRFIYFPGFSNISSFDIEFIESADYRVTNFLQTWRSKIISNRYNYKLPKEYFGTIIVKQFDTAGNIRMTSTINGVWPTQKGSPQYDVTNAAILTFSCTFACFESFHGNNYINSTNNNPQGIIRLGGDGFSENNYSDNSIIGDGNTNLPNIQIPEGNIQVESGPVGGPLVQTYNGPGQRE